jgi:hypothetical protein
MLVNSLSTLENGFDKTAITQFSKTVKHIQFPEGEKRYAQYQ